MADYQPYLDAEEEKERGTRDLELFRRLWPYIRRYRGILIAAFVFLLFSTAIDLSIPYVTKYGIDTIINPPASQISDPQIAFTRISWFAAVFLMLLIIQVLFDYAQVFFSNLLGQKVIYDIRDKLFAHVLAIRYEFFTRTPSGKITTRVVMDTKNLSNFFTEVLTSLSKDIGIMFGVVILMLYMDIRLSLYTISVFPFVILTTWLFKTLDSKAYQLVRTRVSALNAFLSENISGSLVTKLFNQEERKKQEFDQYSHRLIRAKLRQTYIFAVFRPVMNLLYYLALSLLLWFGSQDVRDGFITFGSLYAFTTYLLMFFNPIFDMTEKYDIMQNAFASASKIFKLFDQPVETPGLTEHHRITDGRIRFQSVRFAYQKDQPEVLREISFEIKPNERVAIVGETGSGKTTLIKLISRLYDIEHGRILIDGHSIFDYPLDELRRQIAVVPQDVYLFSGTILDNIRLFREEIDPLEVMQAAETVYADEIIRRMPKAYETMVLERGSTLSAGERQLIALARSVLFQAKIVILDEATANIDAVSEHLIQKALNRISSHTTIISIAHRLATIKNSSRILVIHKGRLVESGTHEELLKRQDIYYDLYKLQFAEE